jgi:transaldolase/glucose-6-phosphate isomerase
MSFQLENFSGLRAHVDRRLKSWEEMEFVRRFQKKDPTLWFPEPLPEIEDRLGWIDLPAIMLDRVDDLVRFAEQVKSEETSHVALLGMGGSSLTAEVFQKAFGPATGFPELLILDSTHPAAVVNFANRIDLSRSLFLVSSKSGTTLETLCFFRYFWEQVSRITADPGRRFVAITDPGSPLERLAKERKFRRIFRSQPDVGGRFSAFTVFGLIPAALLGRDVRMMLIKARETATQILSAKALGTSFGFVLGATMGQLAGGRNKLTFVTSPSLASFPCWVEQIVAESLGKDGKGIIPVVDEPLISPDIYGEDRFFIAMSLHGEESQDAEAHADRLISAGHPLIRVDLTEKDDLAIEIYHWEMAIAAGGAAIGIHPFTQPDVVLTKQLTREAMGKGTESRERGREIIEEAVLENEDSLAATLKSFLGRAESADYFALLAYLAPAAPVKEGLRSVRTAVLEKTRLATTLGYGPQYLHSTGQLHKGGPNTGLFLQLVDEPIFDLPVPETDYSFASLIRAQAVGDAVALKSRGRRVLRVNLKENAAGGLIRLAEIIQKI